MAPQGDELAVEFDLEGSQVSMSCPVPAEGERSGCGWGELTAGTARFIPIADTSRSADGNRFELIVSVFSRQPEPPMWMEVAVVEGGGGVPLVAHANVELPANIPECNDCAEFAPIESEFEEAE